MQPSSRACAFGGTRRPLCLAAILLVILVSSAEAIVKQQQQQQQQQHRSDEQQSASFNQQQASGSSQAASSASSPQQQQLSNPSQQQLTSSSSFNSYSQLPAGVGSAKSSPDYADSSEHSYQAAAQSVNMALVNSGIFGPSSYQSAGSQLTSGAGSSPGAGANASPNNQQQANLNPVHYFYYPSKESSQVGQQQSMSGQQQQLSSKDMLTAASQYPGSSMAASQSAGSYPSYTDQFNSAALSGISASPDVAASSQDPSYLPQPAAGSDNQYGAGTGSIQPMGGADPMAGYSSSQQPQQMQPQQSPQQSMSQSQSQAQQQQPASVGGGSISFKGPSSVQNAQNDYLNSHINHQQSLAYQSLYNQLNDLSTSNFGSGPSSMASYLSSGPTSGPGQQQGPHTTQDLFSSSSGLPHSFTQAASHLSPASVSPPNVAHTSGGQFAAHHLFGAGQPTSQQQQQSLFSSVGSPSQAHYLSPYLSGPFSQLVGSPDSGLMSGSASAPAPHLASAASNPGPVSSTGSSGKRFGIGSFIMPVLALAGLSLLIPTMSNIGTAVGRKKRSIAEEAGELAGRTGEIVYEPLNGSSQSAKELSIGEYLDKLERYYSIYKSALENEQCMNRLICELGVAVKDVSGKSAAVTVIEKLVPSWMTGKMHLFKESAMDKSSDAADKCRKHVCTSTRQHF